MSDELRKRAEEFLAKRRYGACNDSHIAAVRIGDNAAISTLCAFAAKCVAAETARCAKVCRDLSDDGYQHGANEYAEAIEKGDSHGTE